MISPTQEYRVLSRIHGIHEKARYTLFEKYIELKLRGQEKMTDIDSTDQESLIKSLNGGFPIPGLMYTFFYRGKKFKEGTKEYTDLVPLVFCMNTHGDSFSGINMNMLPANVRLEFLQSLYDTFKDFFVDVERLTQNNVIALNKRFISAVKSGMVKHMLTAFNKSDNENYSFAFRKYKYENIVLLRMVEFNEYKYVPFYDPKDAFRLINQREMYKLYGASKG